MILSINQPAYMPWLGYYERIARADLHVVLDHVQFEKNSFTNRNKVRTWSGWTWLSVPVLTSGRFGDLPINDVRIDNRGPWAAKHWKTLALNYRKAPFFAAHEAFFASLFARPWDKLVDLCTEIDEYLLRALSIHTRRVSSTELGVGGHKSELVLNLCRELGASTYLSGALGRDYLDEDAFRQQGIQVVYQDFTHPSYPQIHGDFEPCLAAVDLLFNRGPASAGILTGVGAAA